MSGRRRSRMFERMKLLACLVALPVLLPATAALAAPGADLRVTITPPAGVAVYDPGQVSVRVANQGNRHASSVSLAIQLPVTNTSPTVHVMGTLGAFDPRCTRAGTRLLCNLGTVPRGGATTVAFTIALPYSTAPLAMSASASSPTAELNPADNSASATLAPSTVPTSVSGRYTATNDHCTGTGLTSFFECALYPSSISGFTSVLAADGSVTVDGEPSVTGGWQFIGPDRLVVWYADAGGPLGTVDVRSVGGGCFEGPMSAGAYTVMYEVCLTAAP